MELLLLIDLIQVEDDSQLTSVNEIAAAVKEMVGRIQLEAAQLIT
jgi:hypothetical protein